MEMIFSLSHPCFQFTSVFDSVVQSISKTFLYEKWNYVGKMDIFRGILFPDAERNDST